MLVVTRERKIRRSRGTYKNHFPFAPAWGFRRRKLVYQSAVNAIEQQEQNTERNLLQQFIQSSIGGGMQFSFRLVSSPCTYLILTKAFTVHSSSTLVLNKMYFLEVFKQIAFPEIAFAANPHTSLYRARKGRMVVDATKVASVLTLGPKRMGTVGPIAEDLLGGIIFVPRVVDTMVASKMLGEMIFSGKRVGSRVLITVRTWELRGFFPVTLEVVKASVWFAAFAFKSVMVEGFGVALELGIWGEWLSTFLACVGFGGLNWAVEI